MAAGTEIRMSGAENSIAPRGSQLAYWALQLGGWGFFTLTRFLAGVAALQLPWLSLGLELLLSSIIGLGLSHGLRQYAKRHHWSTLTLGALSRRVILASFIVGVPLGILTQFTDLTAFHDPGPLLQEYAPGLTRMALPASICLEILNWALLYVIWFTLYFSVLGVRARRSAQLRQSEMARALHLAELKLLKSQLNPHFLFNALNTVRSLIAENPSRAQVAVTQLANTLRYTLKSRQDELVTLAEELTIVAGYLEIESMRFEDRLRTEIHIADAALAVRIPEMLVQTLVENAIKHGIAELPLGGLLRVRAFKEDDMLILEVENPRPQATTPAATTGVGLSNARDRLQLLFGGRASLDLDLSKPALATARLRIPLKP
ncbi:MAG TPA: histidine kinase [Steroidobacteraceae bacterium]|jgi:hypothetical protein